jgi:hypothetical protein
LIDGSVASTDPRIGGVGDAESKQLLDALFGKYLKTEQECPDAPGTLDQALEQRNIVPSVIVAARGAFSAVAQDERLYHVSIGECGASQADDLGRAMLVVTRGGAIVAREVVSGASMLSRVIDVDADGQDELLMTYGFTNQGILTRNAKLHRFEQGKLGTSKDLGTVYENGCAGFTEEKSAEHSVVKVVVKKGRAPGWEIVKSTDGCQ